MTNCTAAQDDDRLEGTDGNDALYGEGGDDLLIGGVDDDDFFPGGGDDLCAEETGELVFPC